METTEIKELIQKLVNQLGVKIDEIEVISGAQPKFVIKTADSGILIGAQGEHLQAINHIVRRIVANKTNQEIKIYIDVNNYQENNLKKLLEKADVIAGRVKTFKSNIELDPMSSYERMIIHAHLANDPNIKTESLGFGRDRRVVVKYIEVTAGGDANLI